MKKKGFFWSGKLSVAQRLKRRKQHLYRLYWVSAALILVYSYLFFYTNFCTNSNNILNGIFQLSAMILSALISTLLAIHITKGDIMENDYAEKKDDYGVITFEEGYTKVFDNKDSITYLQSTSWFEFFDKAKKKDKKIYVVGVSITGFFDNNEIRNHLVDLCDNSGCEVYIILGNPYSEEVLYQSDAEEKPSRDHIRNKIFSTYNYFISDISKRFNGDAVNMENFSKRFHILFSPTMPKALIFKSGGYMIVTPYMHIPPSETPTIVVESSKNCAVFNNYETYLSRLLVHAVPYEKLRRHIPAKQFFDQKYHELSDEFSKDFHTASSLILIGMRQKSIIEDYKADVKDIISRNGNIQIVLCDPNGQSTRMCAERSLVDKTTNDAVVDHKVAINLMLSIKASTVKPNNFKIYTWDVLPPYTIVAFNTDFPEKSKIYIWINNMLEESKYRPGFVLTYENDVELVKSYMGQLKKIVEKGTEVTMSYNL